MAVIAVHVIDGDISLHWPYKLHTSCWLWSAFGAKWLIIFSVDSSIQSRHEVWCSSSVFDCFALKYCCRGMHCIASVSAQYAALEPGTEPYYRKQVGSGR